MERILRSNRCAKGSPFQTVMPTTENAWTWVMEVHVGAKETKSNVRSIEVCSLQVALRLNCPTGKLSADSVVVTQAID